MRILVTGAAGYIGSALVRALSAHEVIATDQSGTGLIGNLAKSTLSSISPRSFPAVPSRTSSSAPR
jgi:nucleoside-diphosphate-sugar epimerase